MVALVGVYNKSALDQPKTDISFLYREPMLVQTFKISEPDKEILEKYANALNVHVSDVIRILIAIGLERIERDFSNLEFREILRKASFSRDIEVIRMYLKSKKVI